MVTKRKWMPVEMVESILSENKTAKEKLDKLGREINNLPVRESKPPAPEGGITIQAAGRKYKMHTGTLARWAMKGIIPVLLRTKNETYLDERKLVEVVNLYKESPGQGKKTIRQNLNAS